MARRRQTSHQLIHETDVFDLLDAAAADSLQAGEDKDPLAAALHGELHIVLTQAVAQLPDLLREVVLLRIIQGLSTAETAAALKLSEGTVKVRLHRARQQLYDLLAGYLEAR